MQFNFPEGRKPQGPIPVEEGNVYKSKNTHKTVAWVVLSVVGRAAHLVGIDAEGQITSTQSYNLHALENRALFGRVDLSALEFDIVPAEEPTHE
ncbi:MULTISPECIES: hypothetical protein [Halocynthiibacter]|uniref:Uncharacterized protein n=1 Tax=Halocynthiibacter halioticoli TaxID=2986804 RepID=A0AAE3J251_9RHOB|nr:MULTISPECIES: hypothetical protein [Halocynthiibacter]MCV6826039.1 hypothetical protein [Halocynthiibacter halioticoli]MCW4059040.1 hypothetical protein [Halocynthiibacter sp. SDUM655004]